MTKHIETVQPRWLRDLIRFLPLKSQFVLSGTVRDLQIARDPSGESSAVPLPHALHLALVKQGYATTIVYDLVTGFHPFGTTETEISAGWDLLGKLQLCRESGESIPAGPTVLMEVLGRLLMIDGPPVALIVDFAARLLIRTDLPTEAEQRLFAHALVHSHRASARPVGPNRSPAFNTVFWVVEREASLPDWLTVDNPRIRHIPIPKPDRHARQAVAASLLRHMPGGRDVDTAAIADLEREFVDQTDGLLLTDLTAISQLSRRETIPVAKVSDAIRHYKVGVTEDPWGKIPRDLIRNGEEHLRGRVKGQDHALVHMLDIVRRAVTGVGAGRRGGRPRGVAFLAGPTGVGKTELAKAITSLLFNDENAYIRFDMSEFSAEHADQRLIGAPPGYVGYDAGGELTNAIREKPFSVVLFDEIEKAHPLILDKFLQILDDGVLTSGRGEQVFFSEALIVFTSNLGIMRSDDQGRRHPNVSAADDLETIRKNVRGEIERHFKQVINRPELLNRIGENIIVFDFIRDDIARDIFDGMVDAVLGDLQSRGLSANIEPDAREALAVLCLSDLSNGGRGIRNRIEAHLVNPLARILFEAESGASTLTITSVEAGKVTELVGRFAE